MMDLSLDQSIDSVSPNEDTVVYPHLLLDGIISPEQFEAYRIGIDQPIQAYGLKNGLRKDIGGLVLSHYMVLQLKYMGISVYFCSDEDTQVDLNTMESLFEIATPRKEGGE